MATADELIILEHGAEDSNKYMRAVNPPIFQSSLHTFDTVEDYLKTDAVQKGQFKYGRISNPTTSIAEQKICELEHGKQAALFASGMAATSAAVFATCHAGSHIVCMKDVYGPVKKLLDTFCVPKMNMTITYVKGINLQEFEDAISENTSLIILESPATFIFTCVDLAGIAQIAKEHGVKTFIDNTYSTPLFQNPLDYGIDIVMHTLTKYIGGHSDMIGGALISNDVSLMRYIIGDIRDYFGSILGPSDAYLAIRGLRTLDVRIRQHQKTALAVAEYLESDSRIERVYYPGLVSHPQYEIAKKQSRGTSGLLSFILKGTPEDAVRFVNKLKMIYIGCSWGGFESLVCMPLYDSSEEELAFLDINRGLIRLHCGLEGEENIIADIKQALDSM